MDARRRTLMTLAGGVMLLSSNIAIAQPSVVINTRQFTVEQTNLPETQVFEFNTLDSARAFYDFRSASSHMGIEEINRSWFLLHRDSRPNQGEVAMIVTHGIDESTTGQIQPTATVNMDFIGVPSSVTVELSDDGGELTKPTPTTARGRWRFGRNTDGGVLGTFPPDQDWTVTVSATFSPTAWQWSVYTPNGPVALDPAEDLIVRYKAPPAMATFDMQTKEGTPTQICAQVTSSNNSTSNYIWTINDNPSVMVTGTTTTADETVCVTHTFAQEGSYTVDLSADDGTGMATSTITVQVDNVAPTVDAGGPYTGDEGSPVTLTATATDPGADTLQYRWDFDNDGNFDTMFSTMNSVMHTFPQDGTGTVRVEVSDGTDSTIATATYTIDNVGPTITSMPVTSVGGGETYTYQIVADDPGTQDTLSYSVISGPMGMSVSNTGEVTWDTTVNDVGMVQVEVEVCDDAGQCARQAYTVTVNDITAPVVSIVAPADNASSNDDTPSISGNTDDPSASVVVTITDANGNVVQTLMPMVDAQGNWAIDASALPDGTYTVTAIATDAANNVSTPASINMTVDTMAPALMLATPGDNDQTNDTTPTIAGTSEAGLSVAVRVLDANGQEVFSASVPVDAQGNWSVESSALPEGSYTVEASTTDAAGNTTSAGPNSFVVDVTEPGVTLDAPVDNTTTSDARPGAIGSSEAGANITVTILDNNGNVVQTLSTTADNAGQWSATPNADLTDGTYTYSVEATDAAGNTSSDGPVTVNIDTTSPAIAITSPQDGASTAQVRPAIEGSSDANANVVVEVRDAQNNVVFTQTVVADAQGNWSATPTSDLADGNYTVTAQASDAAGNMSSASSGFTVNTNAPSLAITAPTNGATTNQTQPDITGTTEPNAQVNVVISDAQGNPIETLVAVADAQGNWSVTPSAALADGQYTAAATVTNAEGTSSNASTTFDVDTSAPALTLTTPADNSQTNDDTPEISGMGEAGQTVNVIIKDANGQQVFADIAQVDAQGNWSIDASMLPDGTYTVEANSIDAAGNISAVGPSTFTVDTAAPGVTISAPTANEVFGVRTVDVTGSTEAGQAVVVTLLDSQGNVFETQTVVADANGQFTASFNGLDNDQYQAQAQATDAAGNTSEDTVDFEVDSTDALVRLITPQDGSTTNETTPMITGRSDDDATIEVTITDSNGTVVETLTVTPDAQGQWQTQPATPLTDGKYTITATATRPDGKTATDTASVSVDTMPPALTVDSPADNTTLGKDDMLVVNGTSDPDQVVTVVIRDDAGNTVFTGDVTTDDQGNWSVEPGNLPDGNYTVDVSATDEAGNETREMRTVTIDKTPATVTITSPDAQNPLEDTTPTIAGTVDEPGAVIEIFVDGQKVGETTSDAQGNWSFDLPEDQALGEGMHTIEAKTTDAAGNEGQATITVNVPTPKAPVTITSPGTGATVEGPSVTITGTGEPGEEVTVTVNGETTTVTVMDDGSWMATFDNVPDGDTTITATSGDDTVTVDVQVAAPTDNLQYIIKGGCSSTAPQSPAGSALLMLVLFGLVGIVRRRC